MVEDRPLPAWLPPSRTLGGFYIQRALGAGAGGSVFVVKRSDERNDPHASALALKVPEYDGSAARSLSEDIGHYPPNPTRCGQDGRSVGPGPSA